jgi:hypothetical protein
MQAMSQTQVNEQHDKVEARFEANQRQLAELETEQVELQGQLTRFDIHKAALSRRTIPAYAPWLPFSKNGRS